MQSNKADKKGLKIYITCKRHFKRHQVCRKRSETPEEYSMPLVMCKEKFAQWDTLGREVISLIMLLISISLAPL